MNLLSVSFGLTILEQQAPQAPGFTARSYPAGTTRGPGCSGLGLVLRPAERRRGYAWDVQLDIAMAGRVHLGNPDWSNFAAHELGIERVAWILPDLSAY